MSRSHRTGRGKRTTNPDRRPPTPVLPPQKTRPVPTPAPSGEKIQTDRSEHHPSASGTANSPPPPLSVPQEFTAVDGVVEDDAGLSTGN